ncbi:uncharacterized protein LOC117167380 isoform X8 [Belonocnema kinseyi]|nr:uncharacterized protein LOC117167380 isoform X8 [Belonocnema kinseyi]
MFSILKSQKTGNWSSQTEIKNAALLMPIVKIKEIYLTDKQNKSKALSEIKEKLNFVIEADSGFTDITNAVDYDCGSTEAVSFRGLNPVNMSTESMQEWLNQWLSVSSEVNEISISLLLHCPILLAYNHPSNWTLLYRKV